MYKIRIYEQISSTQLRLIEDVKAGAAEHPVMYLALRQSAGIGSNGRRWEDASAAEEGAEGADSDNTDSTVNDAENNSSPATQKTDASGDVAANAIAADSTVNDTAKITENHPLRTPPISQLSGRSCDSAEGVDSVVDSDAVDNTDAENNSSPATPKTEASGDTAAASPHEPHFADFPLTALPLLGAGNLFLSFTHRAGSDVNAHNASIFYASLIARVLKSRGSKVFVKWPNDFYIAGKKVGGLLTYKRKYLNIVGVGLNFTAAPKYAGVLDISVHLEEFLPLLAAELGRQTSWREIFNEYALSFHKNSEFVLKIGEKTLQMRDARLCSDGSIIIGGERIYGNR